MKLFEGFKEGFFMRVFGSDFGKTLYYMSNGRWTYGHADIYVTTENMITSFLNKRKSIELRNVTKERLIKSSGDMSIEMMKRSSLWKLLNVISNYVINVNTI